MTPVITDQDTGRELWTAQQCATHCQAAAGTWRAYVNRNNAPKPISEIDSRTPLWDAQQVREWHSSRPGQGARTDLKEKP
jgi:hypothetical protein